MTKPERDYFYGRWVARHSGTKFVLVRKAGTEEERSTETYHSFAEANAEAGRRNSVATAIGEAEYAGATAH